LQCFNLKGKPEDNLCRSMAAWHELLDPDHAAIKAPK
jgi:hypothetical protein